MKPPKWIYILFAIGFALLTVRLLTDLDMEHSALLYFGLPFALSIFLHQFAPRANSESFLGRMLNNLRDVTVVVFATSAILFEGFICVLFLLPIYYFGWILAFFSTWLDERKERNRLNKLGAYVIPALVAILSLEGVAAPLTQERDAEATHKAVIGKSIGELKANMARPIAFTGERHWLISVFPLPERIAAGSLRPGDVHKLHFVYRRWIVTNIHRGEMHVKIAEVGDDFVRTEIVKNSSYLSTYMKIKGTEVRFRDLGGGKTEVALTVRYRRLLDPYWYFAPLQKFAAERSAQYLIESVIARRNHDV